MISRRNAFGLGAALSLASVCLTYNAPVLAQDDLAPAAEDPLSDPTSADPDEPPAAEPAEDAAEPEPEAEEPEAEEPEAEEPEPEPESEESEASEAEEPVEGEESQEPKVGEPTASGTSPKRESAVALLGLEHLPWTAYPEAYTRGLKFGSLWLTFHGQQWPYMPMIADEPGVRIGFSGYIWNDLSNTNISTDERLSASAGVNDLNRWNTQTRGILRVTPTYNAGGGWFAQGNAEIVVNGDMRPDPATGVTTTTDDVWVRFGKWNLFDVTFGRFQAWEIANHFGMALDWATLERQGAWINTSSLPRPTDGYGLSYFWDRQNFLLGTYAAHIYPTDYLRAEILGHIGAGSGQAANPYQMDIRPSVIFDIGWAKLKGGWEYGKASPTDETQEVGETKNGFGFAAQFVFQPWVEFGGSFARGFQDVLDQNGQPDLDGSNTAQTYGGFVNASPGHEPLLIGLGAFWNNWENFRVNEQGGVDTNDQRQLFGAVQYTLWDRIMFKLVVARATNSVNDFAVDTPYTNESLSARFRTMILF